jgi:hypothetical protein
MAPVLFDGCGRTTDNGGRVPREQFVQIYGDMLFLAELHRQDTTSYRRSLDSLCRMRAVDTALIAQTYRWYAGNEKELASFHEDVVKYLEKKARVKK